MEHGAGSEDPAEDGEGGAGEGRGHVREAGDSVSILHSQVIILHTARIYIDVSGKVPGWRSAVGLHCKFNRRAV